MANAMDRATTSIPFSAAQKARLRRRLLAWYAANARDLPWRGTDDPYHVWVSEIMLQQTQVATVRNYFSRFIAALPTIESLAAADERVVLRLWEGLGYYRRARQLHAAAKRVVAEHGSELPSDVEALMRLPGVGRYTAGAIASIAFGRRAPILEANTIRLLSRLIAYQGDVKTMASRRVLWEVAATVLPRERVAEFNQALMELGALVCTSSAPRCEECPLEAVCAARAAGIEKAIPCGGSKPATIKIREAAIAVRKNGRVLLRQCGHDERWTGLWDFPRFAIEAEGPLFAREEIVKKVHDLTGVRCSPGPLLQTIKHGVTRYRITLDCYAAKFIGGRIKSPAERSLAWVTMTQLAAYPLCTTGRRISELLQGNRELADQSAG
jgi:A/G-specific adenine glycosylase